MANRNCSGCGKPRDRPGQRYCRTCHNAYMVDWRNRNPDAYQRDLAQRRDRYHRGKNRV